MAEKVYVEGFRGFKPNEKAPDFVLGTLIVTPKEFIDFLNNKCSKHFTEYNGKQQIKFQVLRAKDGGLTFVVDTYKQEQKQEPESNDIPF